MADMTVYKAGGRYWGFCVSQSFGKSKNKGTPQFALTFQIRGEVNAADPSGDLITCPDGLRTVYWYLTDKTMPYVSEDLERLGYNKPSLRFLDPNVEGFFDFNGTEIELYCKHEPYEGQLKEKWSLANPRIGVEAEPLESAEIRKLDALFGKSLKQMANKPTAKPAESPADVCADQPETVAVNAAGDDIPFVWLLPFVLTVIGGLLA